MSVFSKFTKRWFVLDLTKGTFHYSGGKGKKPSTLMHLRVSNPSNIRKYINVVYLQLTLLSVTGNTIFNLRQKIGPLIYMLRPRMKETGGLTLL